MYVHLMLHEPSDRDGVKGFRGSGDRFCFRSRRIDDRLQYA